MPTYYWYLAGLAILDLVGLTSAKFWYLKGHFFYLAISMACFALAAVMIAFSLRYQGVAIVNIIWMALSAILVTVAGYLIFKEPIALYQFIGILIILFGLIVVQWK